MNTRHTVIDSPLGELTLVAAGDTLTGVYFRHHWHPPTADALGRYVEPAADDLFRRVTDQLGEYLAGRRTQFDLPTAFVGDPRQRRLWELLPEIAYGETTTYGELAANWPTAPPHTKSAKLWAAIRSASSSRVIASSERTAP